MNKKTLIIAEKKDFANKIRDAIKLNEPHQNFSNRGLYYESQDYYVSYARGHVLGLKEGIEQYRPDYDPKKTYYWKLEDLPFVPKKFEFETAKDFDPKTRKMVTSEYAQSILDKHVELYKSGTIEKVVHAGDAGREGTLIVYLLDWHATRESGQKYPAYRLWVNDQTEATIAKALTEVRPMIEYKTHVDEGFARMFSDWITGINLTRYATLKAGGTIYVGRVNTAITQALYERHMERKNFIPEDFYVAQYKGEDFTLTSKVKHDTIPPADKQVEEFNNSEVKVTGRESNDVVVNAPLLYSSTTIQNEASKRFNYKPKQTADLVDALYQKGVVSYPRTPAEHLFTSEKDKIKDLLNNFPNTTKFREGSRIFNDKILKDEEHSALLPLVGYGALSNKKLTNEEKNIYDLIANRFQAVFAKDDFIVSRSVITIDVGGLEEFELKGDITKQLGWTEFEGQKSDKVLPNLQIGDILDITFERDDRQTKPPALYSVTTLNNFLTNPFRKNSEEYEMSQDGMVIGTDATRGNHLENIMRRGYASLTGRNYDITDKGVEVIEFLEKLQVPISIRTTAELNADLRRIKLGEYTVSQLLTSEETVLVDVIKNKNVQVEPFMRKGQAAGGKVKEGYVKTDYGIKEIVGKCHFCGGDIVDSPKAMSCNDCKTTLWKENNFFKTFKVNKLSDAQAKGLMTKGQHRFNKLVSKNTKKEFAAIVKASKAPTDKYISFELEFIKSKKEG